MGCWMEKALGEAAMLLLHILRVDPNHDDETRRQLVAQLLNQADAVLDNECMYTVFPAQLKPVMYHDLVHAQAVGRRTAELCTSLLLFRARLPYHKHLCEYHISMLQRCARLASSLRQPGISDRVRIILVDPRTVEDPCSLDAAAAAFMTSPGFMQRFGA